MSMTRSEPLHDFPLFVLCCDLFRQPQGAG